MQKAPYLLLCVILCRTASVWQMSVLLRQFWWGPTCYGAEIKKNGRNFYSQNLSLEKPSKVVPDDILIFSSPEQRSRRAIVLTSAAALASASRNVEVFIKVFKTSLFPNLITDLIHLWYDDTYWSKILHSTIPNPLSYVKVMLKVYAKVFRISLLLNQMMDLVPICYYDRYWSKVFISTISTHDLDLEVEVTDLEFKY